MSQTLLEPTAAVPRPSPGGPFFARLPLAVWVLAVFAAVMHMAPIWRAQAQTPAGWTFTGSLHKSPDFIQYRIWMHQEPGLFLVNKFTAEPNRSHIPAVFYVGVGEIARRTGTPPELVYEYAGCPFAFLLVLLLFATARQFTATRAQTWWLFLLIGLGGGLGAHFLTLEALSKQAGGVDRLFSSEETSTTWVYFDQLRYGYVAKALFDTHFVFLWVLTQSAVLAFYFALRSPSVGGTAVAAVAAAVLTLFHPHECPLLTLATGAVLALGWRKGLLTRPRWVVGAVWLILAWAVLAGLAAVYTSSGLTASTYRYHHISAAILFAAYPLGWGLLLWGWSDYWKRAGLPECFLLGWLAACTAMTLSGPFYAYSERGILTLLVPLHLVGGAIYFARYRTVPVWLAVAVGCVLLPTFGHVLRHQWRISEFDPQTPTVYLGPDHRAVRGALYGAAGPDDVLLTDPESWKWLGDSYPGKHYCAHFFLTVDFNRKRARVEAFWRAAPDEQAAFLRAEGIRFVVARAYHGEALGRVPGLERVFGNMAGIVYVWHDPAEPGQ